MIEELLLVGFVCMMALIAMGQSCHHSARRLPKLDLHLLRTTRREEPAPDRAVVKAPQETSDPEKPARSA